MSQRRWAPQRVFGGVFTAGGGRVGTAVILIALIVVFFIATPRFLTGNNLVNILQQYSVVGILAIAQTIVIISAGIDLSVAATAALAGSVVTVAYAHWGLPGPFAWLIGLASGFAVGAFNGFAVTKWRVPDIIATLGTFSAVRGVGLLVTGGLPVPSPEKAVGNRGVPPALNTLGAGSGLGVPYIVLVAAGAVAVGWFILRRTRLGRTVFAVGGNREAAHASGIKVGRTKFAVYAISALLSSLAGFLLVGRLGSANALMGTGMELQSIAAVVVGGTALFGGEGGAGGTVLGILIIGVLANGLTLLGISEFWQQLLNGLIIVVVVALDQWRRRVAERQRARQEAMA
ncbi:MAG: ABC transporter permease [Streptosporangiales bacterium]